LLNHLLAVPEWYRAILLAQMSPQVYLPLLRAAEIRSDSVVCEMVKGHTFEQLPEVLRSFSKSSLSSLMDQLEDAFTGAVPHFSIEMQIDSLRSCNRQIKDTLALLRTWSESEEGKPKRRVPVRDKAPRAKRGTRRLWPRSRRPASRLPRGGHAR
jgi:hypothetical protein